jgi:hypothetical protein
MLMQTQNRKLGYVLFALAAAGAGCSLNGKPLFRLGSESSSPPGGGDGLTTVQAPGSYAWCKDVRERASLDDARQALDPEAEAGIAVPALLQALCHPRDNARGKRDALEAARRTWMRRLVADERDWATDIVAWGNLDHGDRMSQLDRTVFPRPGLAWSAAGPIEQWALLRTRSGDSDAFALRPGAHYYIADALPLTEAGRLAFLERCLLGSDDKPRPVEWAICQPDLDALDPGKLAAELRGEAARPLADRIAVRAAASAVQRRIPAHAARVQQLIAKDPAYARLFELARAAHKDFRAAAAAGRAELLAAVRAMDDARATGSRKALDGCAARIWPLFAGAVGRLPAKRFENLRGDAARAQTFFDAALGAILHDPDAYLAANALHACEGTADHLQRHLRDGLTYWSGFRGPCTAALTAIRQAALTPDQRDEVITVPQVMFPLAIDQATPSAPRGVTSIGVIATVTDRGDTVHVTFPRTSEVQVQCASRRTTNRISRIDSSGNLHYESVCTRWQDVRVDTTLRPVDVPQRYAAGLKAGRYVSIINSVPEAVWAKASSPTPLAAFGVLLP